jgi:hypothetical protein
VPSEKAGAVTAFVVDLLKEEDAVPERSEGVGAVFVVRTAMPDFLRATVLYSE